MRDVEGLALQLFVLQQKFTEAIADSAVVSAL